MLFIAVGATSIGTLLTPSGLEWEPELTGSRLVTRHVARSLLVQVLDQLCIRLCRKL